MADEKYFYHVSITPYMFYISSQTLDFTVFGTVPKFCVSKVFSQIVSYFLIFVPAKLVNTLVK